MGYRDFNILAEAAFTSVLGAYTAPSPPHLNRSCPYGDPDEVLSWFCVRGHLCLREGSR
ncbi:uncharacterized protein BDV17DRAFT_250351 [Aspergillus undulatus]|uniref:uncharacterized protein n=1 Tax=Aspergillus undulatus TaxID=1810928 RepID=UPI003CCCF69B